MCGIVGVRRFDGGIVPEGVLRAMTAPLRHRGPDGDGFRTWGPVGFGHVRLAIIDPNGSPQPMSSANGPAHITFNGEIFNYKELRDGLRARGVKLVTKGDTEVLLETCRLEGTKGLDSLDGQFAFAYFDEREQELWLARDRMGVLPLYWYRDGDLFAFASEIKSLLPLLDRPEIDEDGVEDLLSFRAVPPPKTLFKGIRKMTPGTVLRVRADGDVREERYWGVPTHCEGAPLDGRDAMDAVHAAITQAVTRRMVADVPVGAYLSGGVDSSLVVGMMSRISGGSRISTFSAGFGDGRYDDLPFAREVSRMLSTDHEEIRVRPEDYAELWPQLCWHRDAPVALPAEIATYRIAQAARRKGVKVLLSGEGSDELFAGYPKHRIERRLGRRAGAIARFSSPLSRGAERLLRGRFARIRVAARAFSARSSAERVNTWFAPFTWYERKAMRAGYGRPCDPGHWDRSRGDHLSRVLYVDCHNWLADNLLEGVDRMSMAAGVESRPPLLDHNLVELAFRVASSMKIRDGQGKWIVKQIAKSYVPRSVVERRKIGFRVPLDLWYREGLRDFVHDLLLAKGSFVGDFLDRKRIERLLADHVSGRRDEAIRIWTLGGLELWHRKYFRQAPVAPAPALV